MFTLPVTPAQHITAKLAVGTVWTLLSLALAVLAAAALIFSIPGAAENGMTLARFSAAFRAEMGTGLWMPAAVMLVLFIIGTVNTYLQLYMCMAIGGQWPTSRLGASIAAYFILNFGLQMLTVASMLVSGVVLAATGAMDALVPMVEHAAPAAVMCAVMGAVGAVLLAAALCDLFLHNALVVDKAAQSRVNWYQKEGDAPWNGSSMYARSAEIWSMRPTSSRRPAAILPSCSTYRTSASPPSPAPGAAIPSCTRK